MAFDTERLIRHTCAVGDDNGAIVSGETGQTHIIVRPASHETVDSFRHRANQRAMRLAALATSGPEPEDARRQREVREADVIEAARRSQTEIRRHVDSYLKEHFEGIVSEVASAVIVQVSQRVAEGIAAVQESNAFQLDRIEANIRSQLRGFTKAAFSKPAKKAKRR